MVLHPKPRNEPAISVRSARLIHPWKRKFFRGPRFARHHWRRLPASAWACTNAALEPFDHARPALLVRCCRRKLALLVEAPQGWGHELDLRDVLPFRGRPRLLNW